MNIEEKIIAPEKVDHLIDTWRSQKCKIVFTNGCFDLIHYGHLAYLSKARALGDKLIVGLNSDHSVGLIKGDKRPIIDQKQRAFHLASLCAVDAVVIFDEADPQKIIEHIGPDILVKGGDWNPSEIVGGDFVRQKGGQVRAIAFEEGFSSSELIKEIVRKYND